MSIFETIKTDLKEAMKAKDTDRLNVLRGILSAFTNELVATGKTPQEVVDDELAMRVLMRASKQRKDSIEQFVAGGRPELADSEKAELAIVEKYLPAMMSEDEIKKVVDAKKAELGVTDKTKAGVLTGAIMKDLKGKADGAVVKAVVEASFN